MRVVTETVPYVIVRVHIGFLFCFLFVCLFVYFKSCQTDVCQDGDWLNLNTVAFMLKHAVFCTFG